MHTAVLLRWGARTLIDNSLGEERCTTCLTGDRAVHEDDGSHVGLVTGASAAPIAPQH